MQLLQSRQVLQPVKANLVVTTHNVPKVSYFSGVMEKHMLEDMGRCILDSLALPTEVRMYGKAKPRLMC